MRGKRYAALGVIAVTVLGGCAQPGSIPAAQPSKIVLVTPPPAQDLLPCTHAKVQPGRSATAADVAPEPSEGPLPTPSDGEAYRAEMMRRQMQANRAYRNRRPLPPAAVPGATACALAAEDALRALHRSKTYDLDAVRNGLAMAGLPGATVRQKAARDLGPPDGLVIGAWTGQACIVGWLSPSEGYRVAYGSQIADGGCLPAAD